MQNRSLCWESLIALCLPCSLPVALWAALLFLPSLAPRNWHPQKSKLPLSCLLTLHLVAHWMPGELNILPNDRESGSRWTEAWPWYAAQKGCVGEWGPVITHGQRESLERIISVTNAFIFHKENKKATVLKWKFSRLGRSWKVKYGARTFCVQIRNLKTCTFPIQHAQISF